MPHCRQDKIPGLIAQPDVDLVGVAAIMTLQNTCGVNTDYEILDCTLNYLHVRTACPIGAPRYSTAAPI